MSFTKVCEQLASELVSGDITSKDELEDRKLDLCGDYSLGKMPSNPDVRKRLPDTASEEVQRIVQRKPTRTASGVAPVAVMTSPSMCPHGKCLYCPGGPASKFSSSQAYTGDEPAAARGQHMDYDPYGQTYLRLEQLQNINHPVDKVELIVMGGTMTARSKDYQEWFVKRSLQAMNDYNLDSEPDPEAVLEMNSSEDGWEYIEDVIHTNEYDAGVKNVAMTFETKPDWCGIEQIDRMLDLGVTKVELGVQTTFDHINREMHRGHGVEESKNASKNLRDSGYKVGYHMMPGQPGMTKEMCVTDFERIFSNPDWKPDYLKIYPTLVVEGTRVYDQWSQGEYDPLTSEEAAEVVADVMDDLPPYVRLQRVQRDIPAQNISAGVQKSNLRQLAEQKLEEKGGSVDDIRSREIGRVETDEPIDPELNVYTYYASQGLEKFISIDDSNSGALIGFCRLRLPDNPHRKELEDSAVVRELHVYGNATELGVQSDNSVQHKGFGQQLMGEAEYIAEQAGYPKITVISGIGVRQYYIQKMGYRHDGPYVSKEL